MEKAILEEVDRMEADVSVQQASRVSVALFNFLTWSRSTLGKVEIPLEQIDTQLLESYQRKRLREVARSTVDKELCSMVRLLRMNNYHIVKPKAKPGKQTEVRPFTEDELTSFFSHCPEKLRPMFLLMLATGARPAEIVPSPRYFDRILTDAEISKLDALGRKLTAHSFRHTWATQMAELVGENQFILTRLLGHTQITTTNRYVQAKAKAQVVDISPYTKTHRPENAELKQMIKRR